MGSVKAITPPVQPSQKDGSALLQEVVRDEVFCRFELGQKEQQGLSSFIQFTMQVRGNLAVQKVSPEFGSQPLHDILPTKLFFYQGQTVAWKVRPFLVLQASLQSEQYCWTHKVAVKTKLSISIFLAFAIWIQMISKKLQRGLTDFQHHQETFQNDSILKFW